MERKASNWRNALVDVVVCRWKEEKIDSTTTTIFIETNQNVLRCNSYAANRNLPSILLWSNSELCGILLFPLRPLRYFRSIMDSMGRLTSSSSSFLSFRHREMKIIVDNKKILSKNRKVEIDTKSKEKTKCEWWLKQKESKSNWTDHDLQESKIVVRMPSDRLYRQWSHNLMLLAKLADNRDRLGSEKHNRQCIVKSERERNDQLPTND